MCRVEDRKFLYQFIPKDYEYLTKTKKIPYKGKNLKTDYIINIIHEFFLKFYFTNEVTYNISSTILRIKYGKNYNYYVDYLKEKDFIKLVSNYFASKKARTYKIEPEMDMIRCKITDSILLKKHKKNYLAKTFTQNKESRIDINLREKLIEDLHHINIDFDSALEWLNTQKKNKTIELTKFNKNYMSIDSINSGHLYYKFDPYGRLHTNFTVLKKYIREKFLKIDGDEITELDISNSQPFFLALFLKDELGEETFNEELKFYIDVVKNGLIYELFLERFPKDFTNRNQVKIMIYKVIFGRNVDSKKESKMFKSVFPSVYQYLKDYKSITGNYKEISHRLQKLESEFIFDNVVNDIKEKFPHIRLFTVHDSIIFPVKYKEECGIIFRNHLKNVL